MIHNPYPEILYGAIIQLMKDPRFYYEGFSPEYGHWTEDGFEALEHLIKSLTPSIRIQIKEELDRRAKALVLNNLKGESN